MDPVQAAFPSVLCGSVISFYPPSLLYNKTRSSTRLGNGVFIAASAINSLCVTISVFTLTEVLALKCQLAALNWICVLLLTGRYILRFTGFFLSVFYLLFVSLPIWLFIKIPLVAKSSLSVEIASEMQQLFLLPQPGVTCIKLFLCRSHCCVAFVRIMLFFYM